MGPVRPASGSSGRPSALAFEPAVAARKEEGMEEQTNKPRKKVESRLRGGPGPR